MNATLYFATNNEHKFSEAKKFIESKVSRVNLKQLKGEFPEIQADSLDEVARFKIVKAAEKCDGNVFIEDAGLFIPSLGGFPSVYSAYVKKMLDCNGILKLLADKKETNDRHAYFEACSCLYLKDEDKIEIFNGRIDGTISFEERGSNGFGFDPIFISTEPEGNERTFAEMETSEKIKVSHRTRALQKLTAYLKSLE
ncbi:MAG: RdgB/HAM1 family non-canonical purine NTP pyrophosphatase [Candidatus Hodarchaeota archaeon]